nr:MAG TPA: hypothetical protein [Caudoviricetes sp.]
MLNKCRIPCECVSINSMIALIAFLQIFVSTGLKHVGRKSSS